MFNLFEIQISGDAAFIASFQSFEEALAVAQTIDSARIEHDFGWGSSIVYGADDN